MILISSIAEDYATNDVIDWLSLDNQDLVRINSTSKITDLNIVFDSGSIDFSFRVGNIFCRLNDIKAFWFRRGEFNLEAFVPKKVIESSEIRSGIYSHLISEELKTIEEFIIHVLEEKRSLGTFYQSNANKLKSLLIAQKVGLKIPDSIISSSKRSLHSFYADKKHVVTKGIQDIMSFVHDEKSFSHLTSIVDSEDIEEMNDFFFPSLLQSNVKKRYELRIFYIEGDFYSMAIFSQEDEQTKVDFRDYNYEKPNRNVPYKLPGNIESKLDLFMKKMNLDTGSIDVIVTPDLEYVFLEVNPVGQYGMTSIPCNYYLDEKIAKYLAK